MISLLPHLLDRAADRDPGRDAVRCRGRALTYGQLHAAACGVARALAEAGVRPGDRVAVYLPKRVEMVAAVYGVMMAGACYVPLDPKAPVGRLAAVAADCAVAGVVTTPGRAGPLLQALPEGSVRLALLVEESPGEVPALPCPAAWYGEVTADPAARPPAAGTIESDLAYILYTSGSTGVPKGVMLSHRNALAFVEWSARAIGTGPEDRFSNHAPLTFDLSVFDLYVAALGGATVVLVPDEHAYFGSALARLVREEGITVWYSVPSALMLLTRAVREPGLLPSLRAVVFAGEVYPTRHLRELRRVVPGAALWNLYGPTETNVVTYYPVTDLPEDDDRTIPIGRACENSRVFALKEDGTAADVGEVGELYAQGPTVMKGYWGRPDRTAEVLVPNPLAPHLPDLAYRTGDLVRRRADGDYDFLGRRDHQVKSRGYRIELGDVEAALNAHPSVAEAVAVAVPHPEWGRAIVAWVVPREGQAVTANQVKRHVAERLPRYMVPVRVDVQPGLPRTLNGKIDRQRVLEEASREPIGVR
jgi:amino acid adenylation domain-containing protein